MNPDSPEVWGIVQMFKIGQGCKIEPRKSFLSGQAVSIDSISPQVLVLITEGLLSVFGLH